MLCMRPTHFPAHRITKKEQKPIEQCQVQSPFREIETKDIVYSK
jgi:hypothetical protein